MSRIDPACHMPNSSLSATTSPDGCLVADGLDNLLLAGRCISSTHEANGSVRITATCFATGEAAGVAAALAAREHTPASAVNVRTLRDVLVRRGVLLRAT